MVNWCADRLARFLVTYLPENDKKLNTLRYGLHMAIYTLISTMGLLLIGLLFHNIVDTIMIIAIFYVNQTVGGGVHARTHIGCFFTMAFFLIASLLACQANISLPILVSIALASLIGLYFLPVVMHQRKAYLAPKLSYYTKISKRVVILEGVIGVLLLVLNIVPAAYVYALFLSVLSRTIACLEYSSRNWDHLQS